MPVFTIQTPEGKKLKIEAADQAAALRGAQEWSAQQKPKLGPKLPVIGDFLDAGGEAVDNLKQGMARDRAAERAYGQKFEGGRLPNPLEAGKEAVSSLGRIPRFVGDLANVVTAPITAAGVRPVARGAAAVLPFGNAQEFEGMLNTALMGVRPGPGGVPHGAPKVAAVRPEPIPKPDLRVAKAMERAITRDGAAPADVAARARANPTMPAFQAGGDNLAGMAEVVAQSPGAGQRVVRQAVRDQQAGASGRVKKAVGEAYNGQGDYFGTLDAAMEARKAKALPLRDAAFGKPLDPTRFNTDIAPVLSRVPKNALNQAAEIARLEGRDPTELGFVMEKVPGGGTRAVQVQNPTLETLHYVKKGMDQELEGFRNALGKLDLEGQPVAAATSKVRGDLGRAMRSSSPEYDEFMRTWGDESGQIEAMRMGRDVFSSTPDMSAERLRKRFAEMSQAEQDMYRKGVGEALIDQVRRKGGPTEARQLLKNEEFRDRVRVAVPDDESFTAFMSKLEDEVRLQDVANRVVGGSPTYARQAARADLEGQQGFDPIDMAAEAMNPAGLPRAALKELLKRVPRKDRSVIGDAEMNELLGNALRDPNEMTRLLNLLETAKAQPSIAAPAIGAARRLGPPLTYGGVILNGGENGRPR